MDYIHFDEKSLCIISHNDCLDMSFLGYECFNLFFTVEDWNMIAELPDDGICFFHFIPKATEFIKIAVDQSLSYDKRYMKLISMRNSYEQRMLEYDGLFPDEWESDIIHWD